MSNKLYIGVESLSSYLLKFDNGQKVLDDLIKLAGNHVNSVVFGINNRSKNNQTYNDFKIFYLATLDAIGKKGEVPEEFIRELPSKFWLKYLG